MSPSCIVEAASWQVEERFLNWSLILLDQKSWTGGIPLSSPASLASFGPRSSFSSACVGPPLTMIPGLSSPLHLCASGKSSHQTFAGLLNPFQILPRRCTSSLSLHYHLQWRHGSDVFSVSTAFQGILCLTEGPTSPFRGTEISMAVALRSWMPRRYILDDSLLRDLYWDHSLRPGRVPVEWQVLSWPCVFGFLYFAVFSLSSGRVVDSLL